jgi:hypothetical protein
MDALEAPWTRRKVGNVEYGRGLLLRLGLVQFDAHTASVAFSDEEPLKDVVDGLEHLPRPLAGRLVVGDVFAQGVGERRAPGEALRAANACPCRASMSRSLCTKRARTAFFLPEARVIGLVPAQFLRALAEA